MVGGTGSVSIVTKRRQQRLPELWWCISVPFHTTGPVSRLLATLQLEVSAHSLDPLTTVGDAVSWATAALTAMTGMASWQSMSNQGAR